jgi:hypothetical protein
MRQQTGWQWCGRLFLARRSFVVRLALEDAAFKIDISGNRCWFVGDEARPFAVNFLRDSPSFIPQANSRHHCGAENAPPSP